MSEIQLSNEISKQIDQFEAGMVNNFPIVVCPLKHRFADGMYIREIFMPAGSLVTSMIHKTTHPYFIMQGAVSVYTERDGEVYLEAGHHGITVPNTRRVLLVHEDCVWVTCHACEEGETVDQIEARIIEPHDNPFLGKDAKEVLKELHRYGLDIELNDKNENLCHG